MKTRMKASTTASLTASATPLGPPLACSPLKLATSADVTANAIDLTRATTKSDNRVYCDSAVRKLPAELFWTTTWKRKQADTPTAVTIAQSAMPTITAA